MELIIVLLLIIWLTCYFFVTRYFDYMMNKKNLPFKIGDATPQSKVLLFILSPLFALWMLWLELKYALITLYVCLPHFGKKNDLSKEELEKMVDEYLKEKEDER